MIWGNVLFSFLYVVFSFELWYIVNGWIGFGVLSEWSPFIVHYVIISLPSPPPSLPTVTDQYNIPFVMFWIVVLVNIYFIAKLPLNKDFRKLKDKMIVADALLGLLYVISNYAVWFNVNQWANSNIASNWSPLLVTPSNVANNAPVEITFSSLWNIPFTLFWVIVAINIFFIVKLRSKEPKIQIDMSDPLDED